MTILPIVERELRVASRHQFTYWSRLVAAAFMLLVFGVLLTLFTYQQGFAGGTSIGRIEFNVLEWAAFIFACSAGVFLTSDSLSEEKREGTLGLLFLTDLRGYDVVLGKLLSHSLRAFYGLLAAFPVLALPLLMGGVTGEEFWRSMLVIGNTLFFSLAAGMMVSSISREVLKAMNATLFLMLLSLIGLPWADLALADWNAANFKGILSVGSPGYLLATLENMHAADFWFQLGVQNCLGWLFLGVACFCVPRAWQERANASANARVSWRQRWRYGGQRARLALRTKLLPKNPVFWLAMRDRWLSRLVRVVLLITLVIVAVNLAHYHQPYQGGVVSMLAGLVTLAVYLWTASQASRFFVESIRNGAMELMLVTPITPRQIVQGQWAALRRTFLVPVIVIVLLTVVGQVQTFLMIQKNLAASKAPFNFNTYGYQVVGMVTGATNMFTGLAALSWFGMWMGMTTKKTSIAVLKTLVFVLVIPWIAELCLRIFGLGFLFSRWLPYWATMSVIFLFETGKNVLFIVLSRRKLISGMRQAVVNEGRAYSVRVPPPLPLTVNEGASRSAGV